MNCELYCIFLFNYILAFAFLLATSKEQPVVSKIVKRSTRRDVKDKHFSFNFSLLILFIKHLLTGAVQFVIANSGYIKSWTSKP